MTDTILLARRQLRLAVVSAVQAIQTTAGIALIDSPGDWNTPPQKLPAVLIKSGTERKDGVARTMPEFTTTSMIEITGRVQATSGAAAQDAIETLAFAVENAVLTSYAIVSQIQKVASIDSETEITAEGGKHLGSFRMSIAFELFEAFDPSLMSPAQLTALTSIGIHFDSLNVFDPAGTYSAPTAPPYTPTAAPRTSGPDGRDEGAVEFTLPQ